MMDISYLSHPNRFRSDPFFPKSPPKIDTKWMEEVLVYTVVDSDSTPWPMRTTFLSLTKRHASRAEQTNAIYTPPLTLLLRQLLS